MRCHADRPPDPVRSGSSGVLRGLRTAGRPGRAVRLRQARRRVVDTPAAAPGRGAQAGEAAPARAASRASAAAPAGALRRRPPDSEPHWLPPFRSAWIGQIEPSLWSQQSPQTADDARSSHRSAQICIASPGIGIHQGPGHHVARRIDHPDPQAAALRAVKEKRLLMPRPLLSLAPARLLLRRSSGRGRQVDASGTVPALGDSATYGFQVARASSRGAADRASAEAPAGNTPAHRGCGCSDWRPDSARPRSMWGSG
jgi:hypothetical protein